MRWGGTSTTTTQSFLDQVSRRIRISMINYGEVPICSSRVVWVWGTAPYTSFEEEEEEYDINTHGQAYSGHPGPSLVASAQTASRPTSGRRSAACASGHSLHDATLWSPSRHRLLALHARVTSTVDARRARHSATSSLSPRARGSCTVVSGRPLSS